MSHAIDQAPKIIREAAKSPLGLLALVVLALAVLAFLFFHDASELVRIVIFCALLLGAGLFSAKAFQIASAERIASQAASHSSPNGRSLESDTPPVRVQVAAHGEGDAPFEVDAIVIEDDTHMVLSADPAFKITHGSMKQAAARAANARTFELGCVVVKPGRPALFLAIVHDLSKEPTWTENSVQRALTSVFKEAESRKLRAIAVPPLGTKHGSLGDNRFMELFRTVLAGANLHYVERVWFVVPNGFSSSALDCLR